MRPMTLPERNQYNKSVDVLTMPGNIRRLPVSPLGWPVPYFVTWFKDGKQCEDGEGGGTPDFRVIDPRKIGEVLRKNKCWVCGTQRSAVYHAFVIGPMCSITKTISEPPSHRDCAIYAARVCPFLAKPNMGRNEKGLYEDGKLRDGVGEAAGHGLKRNPGTACVWITKEFSTFRPDPKSPGVLFSLGRPVDVMWFAHGRRATRDEVMESIDSGYPLLEDIARQEGAEAIVALKTQREAAMTLIPN